MAELRDRWKRFIELHEGAQRVVNALHRKYMRKFVSLALIVVLTMLAVGNWSYVSAGLNEVASKVLLYVHVAGMYTREPDSNLAMPLANVSKNDIGNTWHAPRGDRRHEGQDIFAPRGTPVFSATEGYVVKIGENNLGGQTVSVVGGGGRVYYYAHLEAYAQHLSEGDYVTRKTILGYVGTTGNAQGTSPHLHFGVYAGTGAINPLPLLVDRAEKRNLITDDRSKDDRFKAKSKALRRR
jgi:peptidase M23-like protein